MLRLDFDCGIEKVFLINHAVNIEDLLKYAKGVKESYPELWVGINMLGNNVYDSISVDLDFDGLWVDETIATGSLRKFNGMLFGGLAFKYQPQPKDLEMACYNASITTDVATTSGIGTGKEADITKTINIRKYLCDHPMAIASGVNSDNISKYVGIVDYLLVASSITSRSEMIIADNLIDLKSKI